jgi:hypothetical protein
VVVLDLDGEIRNVFESRGEQQRTSTELVLTGRV